VEVDGDGPRAIDGRGAWLVPSFVDLGCDPGFPGFPTREDAASLGAAALAGGFGDLVTHPAQDPVLDTPENFTDLQRLLPGGCRVHPLAAQTRGLAGTALSEAGLLQRAGVVGLSDGGRPVADTVVLRNALEYARGFGITTWLRPAEPSLDGLGVVNESAVAARMGLRGNPAATEEIGVARIVALVRATGAAVHLWPLGTARAVDMVRFARAEGLPITASVAARSLVLDENALDDGAYNTDLRLHPPLRTEADRLALVRGVAERTLLVCADHASRAPEEKELEFERAVPGATGLETAFAATMTALGDLDGVVEALALGPRRLLGLLPTGARVRLADVTGLALVAPEEDALVMPETLRSRARNEPLARRRLRGVVRATFPGARYAAPHE
jgi:dihydroorotase